MNRIKEYFRLVITAVICFAMSVLPGKGRGEKVLKAMSLGYAGNGNGTVHSGNTKEAPFSCSGKCEYREKNNGSVVDNCVYKSSRFLKKVFFWLQGPGDRSHVHLQRKKRRRIRMQPASSGNGFDIDRNQQAAGAAG